MALSQMDIWIKTGGFGKHSNQTCHVGLQSLQDISASSYSWKRPVWRWVCPILGASSAQQTAFSVWMGRENEMKGALLNCHGVEHLYFIQLSAAVLFSPIFLPHHLWKCVIFLSLYVLFYVLFSLPHRTKLQSNIASRPLSMHCQAFPLLFIFLLNFFFYWDTSLNYIFPKVRNIPPKNSCLQVNSTIF